MVGNKKEISDWNFIWRETLNNLRVTPVKDKKALFRLSLEEVTLEGLYLEFGVYKGKTINYLAKMINPKIIYGFDSFEGLKGEAYPGFKWSPGEDFDLKGKIPKVEENVVLIKGFFKDTIEPFLEENTLPIAFAHLDADLYSSTREALWGIDQRIKVGTILQFDELVLDWYRGEYQAFKEFCHFKDMWFKCLGMNYPSVSVKITKRGKK